METSRKSLIFIRALFLKKTNFNIIKVVWHSFYKVIFEICFFSLGELRKYRENR